MKNFLENRFETRADYVQALQTLCEPLQDYYSEGSALLELGFSGAPYGEVTAGLEGFSRVLWGLLPLWAGGGTSCLDQKVVEGIRHGTDPAHPEYWGSYRGVHQAYVEMASLGLGLRMTPDKIWEPLSDEEKDRFQRWLNQMNENEVPDNNWRFFRVLVNCGLRHAGAPYREEILQADLARIDEFYLGDGWYSDGPTQQRDYYIAFAMHFYGLLYAALMEKEDPIRSRKFRERAALFAKDYIYWFGKRGEALPFGRSLVYRFAQAGFWCALAFSGTEALPWDVIKGIVNRHFRWWFAQPILDAEKKLTLGYRYPNLTFCEGYNAPGSPYWAFKSFLILALPETHPFWTAKEAPLPKLDREHWLPHANMIIQRSPDGYVTALTSGQYADWEPAHTAEKYEKFAYSSYFGFQTARGYNQLNLTAPDNMLAFCKDGLYHVRRKCSSVNCEKGRIVSTWSPMDGFEVETEIIPQGNGHIRKHKIHAAFPCPAVEGGFALPVHDLAEIEAQKTADEIQIRGSYGCSEIRLLQGTGIPGWVGCEPNVNVLHPRTALPYLHYEIPQGVTEISVYVEGIPVED